MLRQRWRPLQSESDSTASSSAFDAAPNMSLRTTRRWRFSSSTRCHKASLIRANTLSRISAERESAVVDVLVLLDCEPRDVLQVVADDVEIDHAPESSGLVFGRFRIVDQRVYRLRLGTVSRHDPVDSGDGEDLADRVREGADRNLGAPFPELLAQHEHDPQSRAAHEGDLFEIDHQGSRRSDSGRLPGSAETPGYWRRRCGLLSGRPLLCPSAPT